MTDEVNFLLYVVKCILNDEKIDDEKLNFEEIYNFSKLHSISNLVFFGIKDSKYISQETKNKFKYDCLFTFQKQIIIENEIESILNELEKNNVHVIFLKGVILKELYPVHEMRSMSDVDIYCQEDNMQIVRKIMEQLGYCSTVDGYDNHYSFFKDKLINIEFHPKLFEKNSKYITYLKFDVTESMNPDNHIDKSKDKLPQLESLFHYIYVFMHSFNHFLSSGIGIRNIIDIWLMLKKYSFNREELNPYLKKYGLLKFENYMLALANKWFGEIAKLNKDMQVPLLDEFENQILKSGTYGTVQGKIVSDLEYNGNKRYKYVFSKIFRPYSIMVRHYKVLKVLPFLLPLIWVYRLFYILFTRKKETIKFVGTVFDKKGRNFREKKELMREMLSSVNSSD